MKLNVKLHPNSSQERIQRISDTEYEVWIKEKPIDGKANKSLEKFLASYASTSANGEDASSDKSESEGKKRIRKKFKVVKGLKSRNKVVEVIE